MEVGSAAYDDGKKTLQIAISEYDQAVLDLAAAVIAGNTYLFNVYERS
jgi:hypothetical protein